MFIPRSEVLMPLVARYSSNCYYTATGRRRCRSGWTKWGRWLLLGILIAVALTCLLAFLCITRRRRARAQTYHPTPTPMTAPVGNAGYYNNNTNANQGYAPPAGPPPPNYGGAPGGGYGGENTGYYGQQSGVAQPQGAYVK